MSGWGSMQVHLLTPGASNPAQVLFAFNGWTVASGYEIGLGNLANQYLGSMDWTFSSDASKFGGAQRMSAAAYEVARIEVWTAAPAEHKTARWTGAGDGESIDSPANWRVTLGETVFDSAIPDGDTVVLIEGQGIDLQLPVGTTLTCAGFEIGDCTLAADCDWRGPHNHRHGGPQRAQPPAGATGGRLQRRVLERRGGDDERGAADGSRRDLYPVWRRDVHRKRREPVSGEQRADRTREGG